MIWPAINNHNTYSNTRLKCKIRWKGARRESRTAKYSVWYNYFINKPGGDYLPLFVDYLKLFVFPKIIWIICGKFVRKYSVFLSRFFEILRNCGLFALFAFFFRLLRIICGFFLDYLWNQCGSIETWIIWDYWCLEYLWIIWIMDYFRLFALGLFADYLFGIIWDYFWIIFGLFVVDYLWIIWNIDYLRLFEEWIIWDYLNNGLFWIIGWLFVDYLFGLFEMKTWGIPSQFI